MEKIDEVLLETLVECHNQTRIPSTNSKISLPYSYEELNETIYRLIFGNLLDYVERFHILFKI